MTPAAPTSRGGRALNLGLTEMVKRGLRGVWVRGSLPPGPVVWAANHHSWWDGFLANVVLHAGARTPALLMDADNLEDFRFLGSIGVVSARRPREALRALDRGRVLVVFPEGDLRAPGPLGPLARGAGWLADRAAVPLVPVAVRVVNRGHQYAEALLDLGPPVTSGDLATALTRRLGDLDATLLDADPREPPPGFAQVVRGRPSWDERIGRWSARVRR